MKTFFLLEAFPRHEKEKSLWRKHKEHFILTLFILSLIDFSIFTNVDLYTTIRQPYNPPKLGWSGYGAHFIHPFVIMLTVPLALVGALAGLDFMGMSLNIYSQIGIVMLIGLAAKNGILIVEFANQAQKQGARKLEAIRSATLNAARLTRTEGTLGSIKAGYLADVIAVPEDPRQDISTMSRVNFVMKDGVVFKR